jgi:parvulin-like peptidyl-prolyl isomerase
MGDPVIVGAAFGLAAGERSGLIETKEGLYVIQSLQHVQADSAEFTTKLPDLRQQLTMQARQDRVRAYLEALRQSATIVDRRKEVLRQQRAPEA